MISFEEVRSSTPNDPVFRPREEKHTITESRPVGPVQRFFAASCIAMMIPTPSVAHQYKTSSKTEAVEVYDCAVLSSTSRTAPTQWLWYETIDTAQARDIWTAGLPANGWAYEAAKRIEDLASRPEGWKGEGSVPPSSLVVEDALAMVRILGVEGCDRAPMISAEDSGGLIFFWEEDDALLSISVEGDGKYSYYLKTQDGDKFGDELPISGPLSRSISQAVFALGREQA